MKRMILFIVALCGLLWVIDVRGQSSGDSVEVGSVTLRLGMGQASVLQELGDSYALQEFGKGDTDSSSWVAESKDQPHDAYANVYFKDGKLATIMKYWTVNGPDTGAVFANALYGAISTFEREGRTQCSIGTGQSQAPTSESKAVFITCGRKALSIDIVQLRQQGQSASITEILK